MKITFKLCPTIVLFLTTVLISICVVTRSQDLPTVYEYFTSDGIQSGLETEGSREFRLNGKPVRIISGALHYFRIHPSQWRDSLRKLRASGANTIETYVAWNVHEPHRDVYDFGQAGFDLSDFADIQKFIKMAQEEDLLFLIRPGPFICAEYEYGGYPSWILQDENIRLRGMYPLHLERVQKFFDRLLPLLQPLQFIYGGPIIGIQLENEYANFDKHDKLYIEYLANIYRTSGFERTLLFTSDAPGHGDSGTIDSVLWTGNFNRDVVANLEKLIEIQPDKALFAMEFWTGGCDWWQRERNTGLTVQEFRDNLEIIFSYNASVNFFMFQGGTNFAFLAGSEFNDDIELMGIVTSYDYDAPLTEAGDYTEKYNVVVELVNRYEFPRLKKPPQPITQLKEAYNTVSPQFYLKYEEILNQLPSENKFHVHNPTSMELLGSLNNGSGQKYGYIIHRFNTSTVNNGSIFKAGVVRDFGTVIVDGVVQVSSFNFGGDQRYWVHSEKEIQLTIGKNPATHQIDMMIENMGRIKLGREEEMRLQRKGLDKGHIYLDNTEIQGFEVFSLEFTSSWVQNLSSFQDVENIKGLTAPLILKSIFHVPGIPRDTYLDLTSCGWHKGIAFINGFNLGRYFKAGPQQRLYVPASVLKTGENTILIFEQLEIGTEIKFRPTPLLG